MSIHVLHRARALQATIMRMYPQTSTQQQVYIQNITSSWNMQQLQSERMRSGRQRPFRLPHERIERGPDSGLFIFFLLPLDSMPVFRQYIPGRTTKFPELLKKFYLKLLYKFETQVPFKVLPLLLDAAIWAPLPLLETLCNVFNGNAVRSHQRFLLNLHNISKRLPLAKNKIVVESRRPVCPIMLLVDCLVPMDEAGFKRQAFC